MCCVRIHPRCYFVYVSVITPPRLVALCHKEVSHKLPKKLTASTASVADSDVAFSSKEGALQWVTFIFSHID